MLEALHREFAEGKHGYVDGMLVVVRASTIRRPVLTELQRVLAACPAAKLGFVLTGWTGPGQPTIETSPRTSAKLRVKQEHHRE